MDRLQWLSRPTEAICVCWANEEGEEEEEEEEEAVSYTHLDVYKRQNL